jgi:predicted AAA+ superfamily ATPase
MSENYWLTRRSKDQIRTALIEQFETFWARDTGIEREDLATLEQAAASPHAVILSGLRRVGKSTLLAQLAHRLGKETFYYINFEDDRFLGFSVEDTDVLFQILIEVFGNRHTFIIDEIQNVPGWEHFVRRFVDLGYKFYISGSNASLLSRELGSRLTGRYVPVELFPFSFHEYLAFRGKPHPIHQIPTSVERAELNAELYAYLESGGIPDALKYTELPVLRSLFDDVLYRDIATRYNITAVNALKELAFMLMSSPSSLVSFNKLKEQLRLGSVNTVSAYIEYLENSWLLFSVRLYDFSLKRQQIAPKKIFAIDTGLSRTVGFNFSPNTGKYLENLVFLALRRKTREIYYLTTPGGYEVDFYLPEKGLLIQVAQDLSNPETRNREFRALQDAVGQVKAREAWILTDHAEDPVQIGQIPVSIAAAAEWILQARTGF